MKATWRQAGKVHVGLTGNTVSHKNLPKESTMTTILISQPITTIDIHEKFELVHIFPKAMSSFTNTTTTFLQSHIVAKPQNFRHKISLPVIRASFPGEDDQENNAASRRKIVTTFLTTTLALGAHQHGVATPLGLAENWGVRSFIRERFFEPGLSPEDAVARIRQTAEGLHSMRDMLEAMAWRYVIFYIRLKSAYLSQDLKNAVTLVPEGRRNEYAKTANELVDNMAELDYYVRTPKVYESYLYYEKTLKSLDDLVALLA